MKVNPEQTLKFFSVSDPLHKYTTTLKDRKYGIIKLPPKICRRKDPDDFEDILDEDVFVYVEDLDW